MAINANTLYEEVKCYTCLGMSTAQATELALLNLISLDPSTLMVGLIGYYKMDVGPPIIPQDYGPHPMGTLSTFTSEPGKLINAAFFDQSVAMAMDLTNDDWVYIGRTGTGVSASMWAKPTALGGAAYAMWDETSALSVGSQYRCRPDTVTGNWVFEIVDGGGNLVTLNSGVAVVLNDWTHLVYTYDDSTSTLKFYVNGALKNTLVTTINQALYGGDTRWCGGNAHDDAEGFRGGMDEWGFWVRPLTQTEVTLLYNGGDAQPFPFA